MVLFTTITGLSFRIIPYDIHNTQPIEFNILNRFIFLDVIDINVTIVATYPNISITFI